MMSERELNAISEDDLKSEIDTERKRNYKSYISNTYTIISILCFFLITNYHYANVTFTIFYTLIVLLLVYRDDILDFMYTVYELK